MSDTEKRGKAIDHIAEQFAALVVKHLPGRLCVTRERIYGQPSVKVPVHVAGHPVFNFTAYEFVEIVAEPVPGGWAHARSPQDLMRA